MSATRRKPYIWVTWLTGLLAGDKHCWYALWYKAHFKFEKLERGDESDLETWRAKHDKAVHELAENHRALGHRVTLEDQNKLTIEGNNADLGGKPDLIIWHPELAIPNSRTATVTVKDVKTGRRRSSDFWQVVVYLAMLPMVYGVEPEALRGVLEYGDGSKEVVIDPDQEEMVWEAVRRAASHDMPEAVPSYRECSQCDIAACTHRVTEAPPVGQTAKF